MSGGARHVKGGSGKFSGLEGGWCDGFVDGGGLLGEGGEGGRTCHLKCLSDSGGGLGNGGGSGDHVLEQGTCCRLGHLYIGDCCHLDIVSQAGDRVGTLSSSGEGIHGEDGDGSFGGGGERGQDLRQKGLSYSGDGLGRLEGSSRGHGIEQGTCYSLGYMYGAFLCGWGRSFAGSQLNWSKPRKSCSSTGVSSDVDGSDGPEACAGGVDPAARRCAAGGERGEAGVHTRRAGSGERDGFAGGGQLQRCEVDECLEHGEKVGRHAQVLGVRRPELNNARVSKTYVCKGVASAAAGLNQAVCSLKDMNMVVAVRATWTYLYENPTQGKALSHFSAVRVGGQRALKMAAKKLNPNNLWLMLVEGAGGQTGVVVYIDQGNVVYKNFLDRVIPTSAFGAPVSGDVVESIMAMMSLHQMEPNFVGKYPWTEKVIPGGGAGDHGHDGDGRARKVGGDSWTGTGERVGRALDERAGLGAEGGGDCAAREGAGHGLGQCGGGGAGGGDDDRGQGGQPAFGIYLGEGAACGREHQGDLQCGCVDGDEGGHGQPASQAGAHRDAEAGQADREGGRDWFGEEGRCGADEGMWRGRFWWQMRTKNQGEWVGQQTKTKAEYDALMAKQVKPLSEGMKIYQARMYKTIMGNDQDKVNLGFKMEDRRWIGVGDLEAWASEHHSYGPELVWNVIRATEDFESEECLRGLGVRCGADWVRAIPLLRVWISEGLTQADS